MTITNDSLERALLDLRYNYLSAAAVTELTRVGGGRVCAPRQKPDAGERQVPVFGRYGLSDDPPLPAGPGE